MFSSTDGILIAASAVPHCGELEESFFQKHEGSMKPVAHCSSSRTPTERRYAQSEKKRSVWQECGPVNAFSEISLDLKILRSKLITGH